MHSAALTGLCGGAPQGQSLDPHTHTWVSWWDANQDEGHHRRGQHGQWVMSGLETQSLWP